MPKPPTPTGPLVTFPVVIYVFTAITLLVGAMFVSLGLYNILVLRGTLGWWALLIGAPMAFFSVRHFLAARAKAAEYKEAVRAYEESRAQAADALKNAKNL